MHSMPNFAVLEGESRHEVERQTTTSSHVRARCSCQTSLGNLLFHLVKRISLHFKSPDLYLFVQQRSFLSSCYHFSLKQAFKVNNLVPMTMHHGRCHWSCSWSSQRSRMLMQKRPVFGKGRISKIFLRDRHNAYTKSSIKSYI